MFTIGTLLLVTIVTPFVYAGILHDATPEECEPEPADFIATAWYAGWHASKGFPVSKIRWNDFTHMTYAFATTTPDVNTLGLTEDDNCVIPEFVSAAKCHGVRTSISIGGWMGSQYFSTAVATAENRTAFVKTLSNLVQKYDFDGIDFDWEYPNHQGVGCNVISPNDTANFLLLLQQLRKTPCTANLTLSAATAITPFIDAVGNASTDVSPFAEVLDFIQIMNYDIWGGWSASVGPNAPLDDSCASPMNQQGSAKSAVKAWTNAGFPVNKIVLGVPSYGHSFSVNATSAIVNGSLVAYPSFMAKVHPVGDAWDVSGQIVCNEPQPVGGTYNFQGLVAGGFLTPDGEPAPGILYRYDNCSQTAYVYNETSQVQVSYDNAQSFSAKGVYISEAGLRGFALWEAGGDPGGILVNAIRGGADVEEVC